MAALEEGETWGLGRWPKTIERPPPPDWEDFTAKVRAGLLGLGLTEAEAEAEAELKCRRTQLRHEWFSERMEAFCAMQDRACEAGLQYMAAHPEIDWQDPDVPNPPEPPEWAEAQAIYAEVLAAVHEDRWPRHLHFRDV
jgi:hypothetical protein